jgi:hypothetical protein
MKKSEHVILAIHVRDRVTDAGAVQRAFSEYGTHIRTRLGLHATDGETCSPGGIILLELLGGERVADQLAGKLKEIGNVETQKIVFGHG